MTSYCRQDENVQIAKQSMSTVDDDGTPRDQNGDNSGQNGFFQEREAVAKKRRLAKLSGSIGVASLRAINILTLLGPPVRTSDKENTKDEGKQATLRSSKPADTQEPPFPLVTVNIEQAKTYLKTASTRISDLLCVSFRLFVGERQKILEALLVGQGCHVVRVYGGQRRGLSVRS